MMNPFVNGQNYMGYSAHMESIREWISASNGINSPRDTPVTTVIDPSY